MSGTGTGKRRNASGTLLETGTGREIHYRSGTAESHARVDAASRRELRSQVETVLLHERGNDRKTAGLKVERKVSSVKTSSELLARLQKVGDIARTLGKYAANWTTGPFASTARLGSATAVRESQAHHVVYSVGKFFRTNFKPWGAVKATRYWGNAGRVIGVAGAILAIFAQIKEEQQQGEQKQRLRDYRDSVRREYRDVSQKIEAELGASYEHFSRDFYDGELDAIDEDLNGLVGDRQARNEMAEALNQVASEAQALIRRIQAGAVAET